MRMDAKHQSLMKKTNFKPGQVIKTKDGNYYIVHLHSKVGDRSEHYQNVFHVGDLSERKFSNTHQNSLLVSDQNGKMQWIDVETVEKILSWIERIILAIKLVLNLSGGFSSKPDLAFGK